MFKDTDFPQGVKFLLLDKFACIGIGSHWVRCIKYFRVHSQSQQGKVISLLRSWQMNFVDASLLSQTDICILRLEERVCFATGVL